MTVNCVAISLLMVSTVVFGADSEGQVEQPISCRNVHWTLTYPPAPIPNELVRKNRAAKVTLAFQLDGAGGVVNVKNIDKKANREFTKVAMEAVKQWRYAPESAPKPADCVISFELTPSSNATEINYHWEQVSLSPAQAIPE